MNIDNSTHLKLLTALFYIFLGFSFVGLRPFSDVSVIDIDYTESGGGSFLRQIIFLFIFFVALFYYFRFGVSSNLHKIKPYLLLIAWCGLSVLWSEHQGIAFRRFVLLFITSATIFIFVSIFTLKDIIDKTANLFVFLVLISLISIPILPGAVHSVPELFDSGLQGNWKGIFIHKNHAGPALVIAIYLFIYKFTETRNKQWLFLLFISFVFLMFTKSKSSLAFLPLSLLLAYLYCNSMRSILISRIFLVLTSISLIVLVLIHGYLINLFINLIDNPEAFTGRATIWEILYRVISDYFWFGLGFGSVWRVGETMLIPEYAYGWVEWVFAVVEAHNGYLEAFVSLGVIGFSLCLLTFIILPFIKSLGLCGRKLHPFVLFVFSIYFFFIMHNLLETDYLSGTDGEWFVLLIFHFVYCIHFDKLKLEK